jgi:hypothetical protein
VAWRAVAWEVHKWGASLAEAADLVSAVAADKVATLENDAGWLYKNTIGHWFNHLSIIFCHFVCFYLFQC